MHRISPQLLCSECYILLCVNIGHWVERFHVCVSALLKGSRCDSDSAIGNAQEMVLLGAALFNSDQCSTEHMFGGQRQVVDIGAYLYVNMAIHLHQFVPGKRTMWLQYVTKRNSDHSH